MEEIYVVYYPSFVDEEEGGFKATIVGLLSPDAVDDFVKEYTKKHGYIKYQSTDNTYYKEGSHSNDCLIVEKKPFNELINLNL